MIWASLLWIFGVPALEWAHYRGSVYAQSALKIRVQTMYTDLVNKPAEFWDVEEVCSEVLAYVTGSNQTLKYMMQKTFDNHGESGLYTSKFYSLHQFLEELKTFGSLEVLSSFQFERYNANMRSVSCPA